METAGRPPGGRGCCFVQRAGSGVFYSNSLYGLLLDGVERLYLIFDSTEVDALQIEAADGAVVHGAVVEQAVGHVGSRSPLRSAGDVGRSLTGRKLSSYGDVEVVENVETLGNGFDCRLGLWSGGLVKGRTHKAGGRCDVAGKTQKSAAGTERG